MFVKYSVSKIIGSLMRFISESFSQPLYWNQPMNLKVNKLHAISLAALTACALAQPVFAQSGKVQANGLGLASANGETTINLTGRVHFDIRSFQSDFSNGMTADKDTAKYGDAYDIRRARIGFHGTLLKDISYEMVFNATTSDSTALDTGYINYKFGNPLQLRVGKFKQQFNLEELTSSNNIDFIERSYVNQFSPGKKLGVMLHGSPRDGVAYGVSAFQENTAVSSATGNTQTAARVALNIAELASIQNAVVHFGAAQTSGSYDLSASATGDILKLRSDARGVDGVFASTYAGGSTANVNEVKRSQSGLEMAFATGALKFQAETVKSQYDYANATNTVDGNIKAQYMAVVYNLTGEKWSDAYKNGSFGGIRPASSFSASGKGTGAWQVALRTSSYDASDWKATTATTGSTKGKTTTLGVNWILNPNARIMLNHSTSKFDTAFAVSAATGNKESVTTIRTQINF